MESMNSESNLSESPNFGGQIVLVLVGLVASGKSTFAKALEEHNPRFRRCNQDDLGNRRAVENLARESLMQGFSVCIDRTNIDEIQRVHWVNIANEVPGTKVWCLVFDTPRHMCAERLQTRVHHPTITSIELGLRVLHGFANDFRPPTADEGFERIMYLRPSDHTSPSYTAEEVASIMNRIGDSGDPARGHNPSGQLTRQRDFMANYVYRGARGQTMGEQRPSWRGGYYSNRGYGRGRSRTHNNLDRGGRGWAREAPLRRQSPHGQSPWRNNSVHRENADFEGTSSNSPANSTGNGFGTEDLPIEIP